MNKKLLTAAVLAAMTLSTASVFANPAFSGDAKLDYLKRDGSQREVISRVRLNVDADIDNDFYVHARAVLEDDLDADNDNNAEFDQAYLGMKLTNADLKAGKQSLYLGKGLIADYDGISGFSVDANVAGVRAFALIGKEGEVAEKTTLRALDFGTKSGVVNFGGSFLQAKQSGEKYNVYGVNADTELCKDVVLSAEYVKNNTLNKDGYLAQVKFGNAVKKGDLDYYVSYRNVEEDAISEDYSTEANYADSKGFKVGTSYKVTDNAVLEASYDFAKQESNNIDKKETRVKFTVNF